MRWNEAACQAIRTAILDARLNLTEFSNKRTAIYLIGSFRLHTLFDDAVGIATTQLFFDGLYSDNPFARINKELNVLGFTKLSNMTRR